MKMRGILVNRQSAVPLHRQLASSMRDAILAGSLAAGERILSSRELQTHLGLSRNTVLGALEQLHAEGYLVTVRGVGTFVAGHVEHGMRLQTQEREPEHEPSADAGAYLRARPLAANLHETRPFRPGIPALDLFPAAQFKRGFKTSAWDARLLDYPDPQGYEPLREAIAQRLRQTRGVACGADQVFITNGAQAALDSIARALLRKGDRVIVEDPGYPNVHATLLACGAQSIPVPVDDSGIAVEDFARSEARLAYVTPSHQYPTGAVLSLERRFALLEWAEKHAAWIVEDDYDSEFNYTGRPQPALHGLALGGRVLYVGTFSKVLSPALRVAYLVVPRSLRDLFIAVQTVTGGVPDPLMQSTLARFMSGGHFGRHVVRMRRVYDERRRLVSEELSREGAFRVRDSHAGLHFIAELPGSVRDADVSRRAAAAGLIVPPLSAYVHGNASRNGLVIGYAATGIAQAKAAAEVLRNLLKTSHMQNEKFAIY